MTPGNAADNNIQNFLTQNGYSRVWPANTAEKDIKRTHQVFYRARQ